MRRKTVYPSLQNMYVADDGNTQVFYLENAKGHPFERLTDSEYLRSIGAAAISEEDGRLHPTAAGMLMFGNEYNIVRHFPEYFLDYREELDATIRWTDRLQSSSGERIDDTPVHKALREALANCLINADYFGVRGVVIRKEDNRIIFANPGYIRTGKKQMRLRGESDPRNKTLMKMFNLINIGERAGSGVPNIFNVWDDEGFVEPIIDERFDPDRTILTLSFEKKRQKKRDMATPFQSSFSPLPIVFSRDVSGFTRKRMPMKNVRNNVKPPNTTFPTSHAA